MVFCYINNITFFTACLVIHERRVESTLLVDEQDGPGHRGGQIMWPIKSPHFVLCGITSKEPKRSGKSFGQATKLANAEDRS
ncbi:hypothetical protein DPMN_134840 [Dreissena polymorpha]|uniref:Uncharacterized protein n=1 Tax=Dreissena polymorpha TaxID=45954 RepID=A0A9D4FXW9_DREPO|nr:hypothetical protein DPMN_134840 [Dreissena polymorpha]